MADKDNGSGVDAGVMDGSDKAVGAETIPDIERPAELESERLRSTAVFPGIETP
jgi:hypothetical protein